LDVKPGGAEGDRTPDLGLRTPRSPN